LSVTLLNVPPPILFISTAAPPVVRLLSFTSRACTVIAWVLKPLAVIDAVPGLTVECAAFTAPGVNVTTEDDALTNVPTDTPPNVAVTDAEPVVVGEVSVAV
jgi:hypothetical protein